MVYDQSKFGIFIHWGVYSVPAFAVPQWPSAEWYWWTLYNGDKTDGGATSEYHNKTFGASFTYQEFAPMFKAALFDPDEWADLFVKSGAKYVVFTSKHHEGFTMWPSPQSWGWNSVNIGPGLDIVGALSKSVKNAGLHMGLYHSLFEWYNPLYIADVNSGSPPTTNNYVTQVLMPQLYDIVNSYEPSIVWADGDEGENSTYWQSAEFLAWLYNNSTVKDSVVVNDRWGLDCDGKNGGFITPSDRFNPGYLIKRKWENCYTIGTSWGYNQNEPLSEYQNISTLLQTLVSTVSCGGNLLLDVGPTSDGVIPMIMQERLIEIGEWLEVNGEAIYNTTFWRVQNDTIAEDIWYTTNLETGAVYAFSYNWDTDSTLYLNAPITSKNTIVTLLGYGHPIQFSASSGHGLTIKLPSLTPTEYPPHGVYTFKLENVK
ncbi:alpha-fucosidase [Heterostelium album PN500]|uniref:alpha-L-fucosidase n=1 Tax=Heterostelium pallidum (strain ATCC 26659 / Pp 5 / PN500) TaxID=670386 RepID=D3AX79_HETP5|nr:alpha-fucosidase [Heterostelium album PN500]EFA86148.1 alpha-fucosidase [Heterostelium album PN500]|eukprot:XP_020438253.1 alpha-fucosidase [Heterostelium album PN500]